MTPEKALPHIALAAAHDLNDEITLILNALVEAEGQTGANTYLRDMVAEAKHAAQRVVWKVAGLANHVNAMGAKPQAVPMERVMLAARLGP
jgi:hypothetical protein